MKKAVILGAELSGCVAANELKRRGIETTVIERNAYLGGGCHTFFYGGHPYTEGSRPLAIKDGKAFHYIDLRCTMCLMSEVGNDRPANMSLHDFQESIDA